MRKSNASVTESSVLGIAKGVLQKKRRTHGSKKAVPA
jgi:hypothetical protein